MGGVDRSGTTLLGSEIGRFEGFECLPESQFFSRLLRRYGDTSISSNDLAEFLEQDKSFLAYWARKLDIRKYQGSRSACAWFIQMCHEYTGAENQTTVFVDQTPANMRNSELLKRFTNDASFIHIIRDGRAVVASLVKVEWGPASILSAADFWLENISYGLATSRLNAPCTTIFFEDFILDSDSVLITALVDIGFEPDLLKRDKYQKEQNVVSPYNLSQHALVGGEIQRSKVDTWRYELSKRDIEIVEAKIGGLLAIFGYQRLFTDPKPISRPEKLDIYFKVLFWRYFLNKVRRIRRMRLLKK